MNINQTAIIHAANYHMTKAWERQSAGQDRVPSPGQRACAHALYNLACKGETGTAAYGLALAKSGGWV